MPPRTWVLALLLCVALACDAPSIDAPLSKGGNAPDPTGRITGSVIYIGPRPVCATRGGARRVVGRVILTLFHYDNPPPPEGSASSALNLMVVPGEDLFDTADCLPDAPSDAERAEVVMRTVPFAWPAVALGQGGPVAYQIRGFYDYDADMNPFFSVRNLPTRGDIAGGAVERVDRGDLARIQLPAVQQAPLGASADGVTVLLGRPVWTERPMFKLGAGTTPLRSNATIPLIADPLELEQALWELSSASLQLLDASEIPDALAAAGIDFDFTPQGYAFFVSEVDADGDGQPDEHPVLGSQGTPWLTPLVFLQRVGVHPASEPLERQAGIPAVTLVPTVRVVQTQTKKVFAPAIDITVPPIAVVDLDPTNPACRIPYVPPGNLAELYEAGPTVCDELPTGLYRVNVLSGVAGGRPVPAAADVSDVGIVIEGGAFSGQAWTIPNELGSAAQLGDGALAVPHQGVDGMYLVHDPNPEETASCGQAPDMTGTIRAVNRRPVPDACCGAIAHLCGLPLCEVVSDPARGLSLRGSPTRVAGGRPDCVPYPLPADCCPGQ